MHRTRWPEGTDTTAPAGLELRTAPRAASCSLGDTGTPPTHQGETGSMGTQGPAVPSVEVTDAACLRGSLPGAGAEFGSGEA